MPDALVTSTGARREHEGYGSVGQTPQQERAERECPIPQSQ